jgi:carboxymethylenebutenolidase
MSGSFIVTNAARFSSRMAAAAAFYGTQIITDKPDSPHLIAPPGRGGKRMGKTARAVRADAELTPARKDAMTQPLLVTPLPLRAGSL